MHPGQARDPGRFSDECHALDACRAALNLPRSVGDGSSFHSCPLAGMRSAELASGAAQQVLDELARSYMPDLLNACMQ
eukprot:15071110-Alexandrium_andersonii.AAC.1